MTPPPLAAESVEGMGLENLMGEVCAGERWNLKQP